MPPASIQHNRAALVLMLAVLAVLFGCKTTAQRRADLATSYPLERVQAAVALAEQGDAQAVDLLINNLEHRDAAVRLYAVLALERLTGENYGFEYYAPAHERAAAVARWRAARQQGDVTLRAAALEQPAPDDSP